MQLVTKFSHLGQITYNSIFKNQYVAPSCNGSHIKMQLTQTFHPSKPPYMASSFCNDLQLRNVVALFIFIWIYLNSTCTMLIHVIT